MGQGSEAGTGRALSEAFSSPPLLPADTAWLMGTPSALCSGFGGLDLGLERAGWSVAWHVENDPGASAVLDRHWPGVPNHSDLKAVDWSTVEPVDLLAGGYPCQPFSHAGRRRGEDDPRHLWPFVCAAIRHLRPRLALLENVAGHRSLGFGRVLGDLAEVGYDATWASVRASDVGAPHGRERVFILAQPSDTDCLVGASSRSRGRASGAVDGPGEVERTVGLRGVADGTAAPADTHGGRLQGRSEPHGDQGARLEAPRRSDLDRRHAAPPDTDHAALDRQRPRPQSREGDPAAAHAEHLGRHGSTLCGVVGQRQDERRLLEPEGRDPSPWGEYEPAIRRWEHAFGERAPDPLDERGRLNVDLTRWMMGFPPGWHGDLGRTAALRGYGNAVQVQVAELVGRWAAA